jgi:hypothetical protein
MDVTDHSQLSNGFVTGTLGIYQELYVIIFIPAPAITFHNLVFYALAGPSDLTTLLIQLVFRQGQTHFMDLQCQLVSGVVYFKVYIAHPDAGLVNCGIVESMAV